eukprot:TRINITY_DN7577_c0_g1_i1.p1 TRINITY_DN7577_c0_g1~~TRINITY_DN7577_c0_g1_i1.p1  ORF type:complete len:631 (-),score=127.68 TRINITY_DN7577_c0_g1_i1:279-2171(-)
MKPMGYWKDKRNRRLFFDEIFRKCGFTGWEDWYRATHQLISDHGGSHVLRYHNGTLISTLIELYPEIRWKFWKFDNVPHIYWQDLANQRAFLEDLGKEMSFNELKDWYKIKPIDIKDHGGACLLNMYERYLPHLVKGVFPEHRWKTCRFEFLQDEFWKDSTNHREILDEVGSELGVRHWEDWYQVRTKDVQNFGGVATKLAALYPTLYDLLATTYTEHEWNKLRFNQAPEGYWNSKHRQMQFLERLGKHLNFEKIDDWYQISREQIEEFGGAGLLQYYNGSPVALVTSLIPDHDWKMWRFKRVPNNFWQDENNVREYLRWLTVELDITAPEDWYQVSYQQLLALGCKQILDSYGGLTPLLTAFYPEQSWPKDAGRFSAKIQQILFRVVKNIFGTSEVLSNYLHPTLIYKESGKPIELDVFVPAYKLAFEYQGEPHFMSKAIFANEQNSVQKRDAEKKVLCRGAGITLIEVPYWWNHLKDSLLATIHKHRPDIFVVKEQLEARSSGGRISPIPEENPKSAEAHSEPDPEVKYFLSNSYSANHGKCAGCGRPFLNRKQLRVVVPTIRKSTQLPLTRLHFCVNADCVRKASLKPNGRIVPTFDGRVRVPYQIENEPGVKELENIEGFQWIRRE